MKRVPYFTTSTTTDKPNSQNFRIIPPDTKEEKIELELAIDEECRAKEQLKTTLWIPTVLIIFYVLYLMFFIQQGKDFWYPSEKFMFIFLPIISGTIATFYMRWRAKVKKIHQMKIVKVAG